MKILGFEIARAGKKDLQPADNRGGWWGVVRESFAGAWQSNVEIRIDTVLTYSAVYSCITLIASDISKLRIKLVAKDDDGIWTETTSPAFSPVLRKPNGFQTWLKFTEQWVVSKLVNGNTYVLKERDGRGVVVGLHLLDACRVTPLVADDGSVFYQLKTDRLAGIGQDLVVVPQREIIHDVMVPLYHPLVGVSPIHACGLAAVQGLSIQSNSTKFFQNGSRPSGVLTAPGSIKDETAARLKTYWEENFSGKNVGRVAVLGDGLKYESMVINAVDAQLIEQLKWTAETVCSCFHVPAHMVGVGSPPSYNNIEALSQQYYSQCLQALIESMESCLDDGLGTGDKLGTEFDLDDLLRMDTATKVKAAADAVQAGILKPNEARAKFDLKPVKGGDTPYLQQQNFSLAALNKRDTSDDPFAKSNPAPAAAAQDPAAQDPAAQDASRGWGREEMIDGFKSPGVV